MADDQREQGLATPRQVCYAGAACAVVMSRSSPYLALAQPHPKSTRGRSASRANRKGAASRGVHAADGPSMQAETQWLLVAVVLPLQVKAVEGAKNDFTPGEGKRLSG